jgi:hypothetical protein
MDARTPGCHGARAARPPRAFASLRRGVNSDGAAEAFPGRQEQAGEDDQAGAGTDGRRI